MIRKIKKINSFGIFDEYTSDRELPYFEKYNLIYGWNASGKTTLSRLFQCFELKEINNNFNNSNFQLETDEGELTNESLESIPHVRVFNSDFIKDNIFKESGVNPIYYLGEGHIKNKEELDMLKENMVSEKKNYEEIKKLLEEKRKEEDKFITTAAKNIKDSLRTRGHDKYTNYNKSIFTERINNIEEKKCLDSKSLDQNREIIIQSRKDDIREIRIGQMLSEIDIENLNNLLKRTVTSNVIEKLKKDQNLNNWIMQGMSLHRNFPEGESSCFFCEQNIPISRIDDLKSHFNEEYKHFIKEIKSYKNDWASRKISEQIESGSSLYDDLCESFTEKIQDAIEEIKKYNIFIQGVLDALERKIENPFEEQIIRFQRFNTNFFIDELNNIIKNHNNRNENFERERLKKKEEMEIHYLSEYSDAYKDKTSFVLKLNNDKKNKEKEIDSIQNHINQLSEASKDYKRTAKEINKKLESFFGKNELKLESSDEIDGYCIKTSYNSSKTLSEGEKTAIALVYFLVKLNEESFSLGDGIVVIDDPISSLDSNFIFQAFGFIKNELGNAGQVFILTHNFDFFKNVKHWFKRDYMKEENKKAELFMIKNFYIEEKRRAGIYPLDKLLIDYDSEYQYLFKILYQSSVSDNDSFKEKYPLPNVARKFLETFLSFKFPSVRNNEKMFSKAKKKSKLEPEKIEKIKRFINAHSHSNIDKIHGWDMSQLSESKEIIKDILYLVEKLDNDHYEALCDNIRK